LDRLALQGSPSRATVVCVLKRESRFGARIPRFHFLPVTLPRILVHTSLQSIRWGDMDAFDHVNNTVYFRYMEQARIEWLYGLATNGLGHADEEGPVVVTASCEFLVPLVYPGDIEVRMFLGDLGRSSIGTFYEIWLNERMFARGAAKMVWINRAIGRSTLLPAAVTGIFPARST
jgi:acyl-CoA thioester hydrolase